MPRALDGRDHLAAHEPQPHAYGLVLVLANHVQSLLVRDGLAMTRRPVPLLLEGRVRIVTAYFVADVFIPESDLEHTSGREIRRNVVQRLDRPIDDRPIWGPHDVHVSHELTQNYSWLIHVPSAFESSAL